MRKTFAAVFAAVFAIAAGAGSALAGEVKGPPTGTPGQGGFTPIENGVAASNCAYNGLNDFIQGQTDAITQNYGTNIKLGIDAGFPGDSGFFGCNPAISPPGLG